MEYSGPEQTGVSDISVVICAYTEARWDDMMRAIASAKEQSLAAREIVVIVDNNPALLERLAKETAGVKVAPNTDTPGLSGARNTGFRLCEGDKVAYLDDDAWAEPGWLEQLDAGFASDNALGVGGHAEPNWAAGRPRWFPASFDWVVGCSYIGLPKAEAQVRNPIGCNMMIRRDVLIAAGGFRSGLGRVGTIPLGGEETEFAIRASATLPGGIFMYAPAARVSHSVPPSRGKLAYFIRRCYGEGLSKAAISRLVGRGSSLSSESSYATRVLPRQFMQHLGFQVKGADPYGALKAGAILLGLSVTTLGFVAGAVRSGFAPKGSGGSPVAN